MKKNNVEVCVRTENKNQASDSLQGEVNSEISDGLGTSAKENHEFHSIGLSVNSICQLSERSILRLL